MPHTTHPIFHHTETLPVSVVLDEIKTALMSDHELILEAPPGAGKTTLVPLSLLNEPWLKDRKILVMEPRRIAARAAAQRMADLLAEPVGKRVGYRIRMESCVSKETRIEVITEGILTRRLQRDPALDNVALVIFDEFHERSLDADLGLALCLQARSLLREEDDPLKILVMSATLNSQALVDLLEKESSVAGKENTRAVKTIRSEGRMFPVDIIYHSKNYGLNESVIDPLVQLICQALERDSSSILVFLPGQSEIRRVQKSLAHHLSSQSENKAIILPLYGGLSLDEQRRAILPLAPAGKNGKGERKVVLSTDIAETSLTIEGVSVVIDSGLRRVATFDPLTGMTRLHTRRISMASSIQRMGRAGRLEPGRCYRLWTEDQQNFLVPHTAPEIMHADLAPLALQLIQWGVNDPAELDWLDQPPQGPYSQSLDLLVQLKAIKRSADHTWVLTEHGKRMSAMPLHPRLAHMLLCSKPCGLATTASMIAAILSDRDPLSQYGADLALRLSVLTGELDCPKNCRNWLKNMRQQVKMFERLLAQSDTDAGKSIHVQPDQALGFLLACAYPDRIARRRKVSGSNYQLSNGRSVILNEDDSLGQSEWLSVAEAGGQSRVDNSGQAADRIFLAAVLDPKLFNDHLGSMVTVREALEWDEQSNRFIAEQRRTLGSLVISSKKIMDVPVEVRREALVKLVIKKGLQVLPWTPALKQWQARVMLVKQKDEQSKDVWPDVSDRGLLAVTEVWLEPYLDDISTLADFKKLDLNKMLASLLSWPQSQSLSVLAPEKIKVPSGSNILIDYLHSPPVLSVKLQEMFGCEQTPTVVNGKVDILVHLLSPAGRPLQVTQDLAGFWSGSYEAVKKEMKGRYPRHPWPDNPLEALPTRHVKRRL